MNESIDLFTAAIREVIIEVLAEKLKDEVVQLMLEDIQKHGPMYGALRKELGLSLNRRVGQ